MLLLASFPHLFIMHQTNTFQAIVITNGTKSYAVFTYMCNLVEWSDEAGIGFNAAGEFYANHPLSGQFVSNAIDCVHQPDSIWNNVIYDLVPGSVMSGATPEPPTTVGEQRQNIVCVVVYLLCSASF